MSEQHCPICDQTTSKLFTHNVLNHYDVAYYQCQTCLLIRTESPYWLKEAYSEAISTLDTGIMFRNCSNAKKVIAILTLMNKPNATLVDLGAGYGVLGRLLRDKGIDTFWTDKYCENLFLKGFEATPDKSYDGLLAFEVLEHIHNPVSFLADAFSTYQSQFILFSTLTFPEKAPQKDWWYYSFDTGQHISLYAPKTLTLLAKKLHLTYYPISENLHLFTKEKLPRLPQFILSSKYLYLTALYTVNFLKRKHNFSFSDRQQLLEAFE